MSVFGFLKPARFKRDEAGTTMVEFAICISLFLLIFFAVLDFGRLAYNWVMAEKAMQRAVRIAAVRTPMCPGVPRTNLRADVSDGSFPTGTICRQVAGLCFAENPAPCTLLDASNGSPSAVQAASEIWQTIRPLLPDNATNANVLIRYEFDPQLGFLGGPYTPMITAELVGNTGSNGNFSNFEFTFVTPLSALAASAGASDTNDIPADGASIPFPGISASMPAEDLNLGGGG
ncbi:pilus assembly protein [Rhodobacteraceae bacterium]|nr:pilus assembly protein [Paracoccaceae bacterium]